MFVTCTYSKLSWYWFGRECEKTKPSVVGDSHFTSCSCMRTIKESVPYSIHSPSDRLCLCLVCLLTQTNKRQRTHLPNKAYGRSKGETISYDCFVRCIRRPTDKQWDTDQHRILQKSKKIIIIKKKIWNSSLVTKPACAFIHETPNELRFFVFRIHSILSVHLNLSPLSGVWNGTDHSSRVGKEENL